MEKQIFDDLENFQSEIINHHYPISFIPNDGRYGSNRITTKKPTANELAETGRLNFDDIPDFDDKAFS